MTLAIFATWVIGMANCLEYWMKAWTSPIVMLFPLRRSANHANQHIADVVEHQQRHDQAGNELACQPTS